MASVYPSVLRDSQCLPHWTGAQQSHLSGCAGCKAWGGVLCPKRISHTALCLGIQLALQCPLNQGMLTAFGDGLSEPPSLLRTTGFVLAGDSGDLWAGAGEGNLAAGWDRTFFPECSSVESDEGLFTPAMPPTGMRHREQGLGGSHPELVPPKRSLSPQ